MAKKDELNFDNENGGKMASSEKLKALQALSLIHISEPTRH